MGRYSSRRPESFGKACSHEHQLQCLPGTCLSLRRVCCHPMPKTMTHSLHTKSADTTHKHVTVLCGFVQVYADAGHFCCNSSQEVHTGYETTRKYPHNLRSLSWCCTGAPCNSELSITGVDERDENMTRKGVTDTNTHTHTHTHTHTQIFMTCLHRHTHTHTHTPHLYDMSSLCLY
jgi:hypothetical protein